jgi:hypothetical protein
MSQQTSFNGQIYTIPDTSDEGWGENVTNYLLAIPQGALQKIGGNFTLTANVNFGPSFGLLVKFLSSRDAGAAAAGLIRLATLDQISWRNNAGIADLSLGIDGSDNLTFNGVVLQPAGNYITELTGDVAATGPGSAVATIQPDVITDSMVKSDAGIARSKLASGTNGHVLINDPSTGAMSSEAQLAIARGGTGQSTAQAALDALLPTQSGQTGKFLTTDGTTSSWGNVPTAKTASYQQLNLGLATSVAANALTIALKQADGSTDPASGAGSVDIGFRDATSTNGDYNIRSITSSLSLTIPSGASLGQTSGMNQYIWVYALDNAGTIELAVSGVKLFDDYSIQSSTTISGSATSGTTLYSSTGHSNVPVRLIGRLLVSQTVAGTWASNASEVALVSGKQPVTQTPWALTPVTGAWTANTAYTVYTRRVGDTFYAQGAIGTTGAPTSAQLTMNIPNSLVIDSSKMASSVGGQGVTLGQAVAVDSGSADYQGTVALNNSTSVIVYVFSVSGTRILTSTVTATSPFSFGNNDGVSFNFSCPIVGWSINGP